MKKQILKVFTIEESFMFENPTQIAVEPNAQLITIVTAPETGRTVRTTFPLRNVVRIEDDTIEGMISVVHGGVTRQ